MHYNNMRVLPPPARIERDLTYIIDFDMWENFKLPPALRQNAIG